MNIPKIYGDWLQPHTGTGYSFNWVKIVGWASVAITTMSAVGTGGELQLTRLQEKITHPNSVSAEIVKVQASRTPAEDLNRIREVLSPAVSDLAITLNVTRQSVYNWLKGDPVAPENAIKLRDLAQAADLLAHEGIAVNSLLLKRKFANGKTLFQVAQMGESARGAASLLVQILGRESDQRERMSIRFSSRAKTSATADFDLPASNTPA